LFKTRDWFVLVPIAALALALAMWGYYPCVGVNCKPDSLWTILQESFNLVRGGSDGPMMGPRITGACGTAPKAGSRCESSTALPAQSCDKAMLRQGDA